MKTMGQISIYAGEKMLSTGGIKFQAACRHGNVPSDGCCAGCYAAVALALGEIRDVLFDPRGRLGEIEIIMSRLSNILSGPKEKKT